MDENRKGQLKKEGFFVFLPQAFICIPVEPILKIFFADLTNSCMGLCDFQKCPERSVEREHLSWGQDSTFLKD